MAQSDSCFKIPDRLKKASYVLVPADPDKELKTLSIDLSDESAELTVFLDEIKKHYRKNKRTKKGESEQVKNLKQQIQQKYGNSQQINANLLNEATSFEMVGTIQLMQTIPNMDGKRTKVGSSLFNSVQMYLDDNGEFKNYQRNHRAESIVRACCVQRLAPIKGDVFISMYYDDDENFRRLNFDLNELDSNSETMKEIVRRNKFKQMKKAKKSEKKKEIKKNECNQFKKGDKVKIDGLKSKPTWNGKIGQVVGRFSKTKKRWPIELIVNDKEEPKKALLKAVNLCLAKS